MEQPTIPVFLLPHPWSIQPLYYSPEHRIIGLRVDYNSREITCPMCGSSLSVDTKRIVTLKTPDIEGMKTDITACIPVIECRSKACLDDQEQATMSNFLMLQKIANHNICTPSSNPL